MDKKVKTVPLLVEGNRLKELLNTKYGEMQLRGLSLKYQPYWISCYTFHIPRIFMKPRALEIWIACDARSGGCFPIRIDSAVFEDKRAEEEADFPDPSLDSAESGELTKSAAYEAFVKRYLAMRDPKVELSFHDLVYFPFWLAGLENSARSRVEVLVNGRTGAVERKTAVS